MAAREARRSTQPRSHAGARPPRRAPCRRATAAESSVGPLSTTIGVHPRGMTRARREWPRPRRAPAGSTLRIVPCTDATRPRADEPDRPVSSVHVGGSHRWAAARRSATAPGSVVDRPSHVPDWWALGVWAAVIVAARVVLGSGVLRRAPAHPVPAARRVARLATRMGAVAPGRARDAPRRAGAVDSRPVLAGGPCSSARRCVGAAWAVALALLDGTQGLVGSVTLKNEYLLDVGRVGSPLDFLGGFVEPHRRVPHPRAGSSARVPPGPVVPRPDRPRPPPRPWPRSRSPSACSRCPPCCSPCARWPATTRPRGAAPFVAVAPLAIWVATSADAFYAGVGAWAVALVVLATGRPIGAARRYALAGGLLFGVGRVPLLRARAARLIPLAVALAAPSSRPLVVAAARRSRGVRGVRARRVLVVRRSRRDPDAVPRRGGVTPALRRVPAGRRRLPRHRRSGLRSQSRSHACAIVGCGCSWAPRSSRSASPALSGMSKGEVERIWLPFAIWVLPAGAALAVGRRHPAWLAAQVAFAIGVQTLVRSPW